MQEPHSTDDILRIGLEMLVERLFRTSKKKEGHGSGKGSKLPGVDNNCPGGDLKVTACDNAGLATVISY